MKRIKLFLPVVIAGVFLIFSACSSNSEKGDIYKIKLRTLSYDSSNENGSRLIPGYEIIKKNWGKKYAEISTGEEGFAVLSLTNTKPDGNSYIEREKGNLFFSMPSFEYRTDDYSRLKKINFTDLHGQFSIDGGGFIDVGKDEIYMSARVYKGKITPLGFYCDGLRVEDILSDYNTNFDALYQAQIS